MGLFSYFANKREEKRNAEKTAAYISEGRELAAWHCDLARAYVEKHYRPQVKPDPAGLTKEPAPEEKARMEAEKRLAEKKRRQEEKLREKKCQEERERQRELTEYTDNYSSEVRFSLSCNTEESYYDDYHPLQLSPEELARRDLLETARQFLREPGTLSTDVPFIIKVRQIMQEKNLSASDIYRRAQIDKTTFSKLSNNLDSCPTKDTAISLALGLELSLAEASDLLRRAGYALSHSMEKDIIVEYCFENRIYNVVSVNCILSDLGLKPLGRIIY